MPYAFDFNSTDLRSAFRVLRVTTGAIFLAAGLAVALSARAEEEQASPSLASSEGWMAAGASIEVKDLPPSPSSEDSPAAARLIPLDELPMFPPESLQVEEFVPEPPPTDVAEDSPEPAPPSPVPATPAEQHPAVGDDAAVDSAVVAPLPETSEASDDAATSSTAPILEMLPETAQRLDAPMDEAVEQVQWQVDSTEYMAPPPETPYRWSMPGVCAAGHAGCYGACGVGRHVLDKTWRGLGYVHLLNVFDLPDTPHRGIGEPLVHTSWRKHPAYAGWNLGPIWGSELISDWTSQTTGYIGSFRLGYDFDDYFGVEARFGFASITIRDSAEAIAAQQAADAINFPDLEPDDPFHDRFDRRRANDVCIWDVSLLYYPLGNTTWRPYLGVGVGVQNYDFTDRLMVKYSGSSFSMPLSVGLKYFWDERTTLRVELTDNLAFSSSPVKTQNNISLMFGMDVRFGAGRSKAYWPYSTGAGGWW